jgi:hypothetical protein
MLLLLLLLTYLLLPVMLSFAGVGFSEDGFVRARERENE